MNYFNVQKQNSIKPIVIDFSNCNYLGQIHKLLKEKLDFPDYYGENWDALEDCLDDKFSNETLYDVQIIGYNSLEKELREYCSVMLEIFEDIHLEHPNVNFTIVS